MRVLVTGAAGFAGYHIANSLAANGHSVTGMARTPKPSLASFTLIGHDLSEPILLDADFDVIVHAAGSHPGGSALQLKRDNIDAMENIVDFAERRRIPKIIFLSSISVYGQIRDDVVNEETCIINPDIYGLSKYVAEKILRDSRHVKGVCLRLPGIVGSGAKYAWLNSVVEQMRRNVRVRIHSSKFLTNNFIHIDDLAKFVDILVKKETSHEIFVLGMHKKIAIKDCVEFIKACSGSKSEIEIYNTATKNFSLDIMRAHENGFSSMSPEEAIRKLF